MIIKEGFDSKPLHIRIGARQGERSAELWIEQEGLKNTEQRYETLSYITLDELLNLQDEVKNAIQEIVK